MAQNHVIDPTFFFQAIDIFEFPYDYYRKSTQEVDENYEQHNTYEHFIIRGSLQSQGKRVKQSLQGNNIEVRYDFYCKTLYKIDRGDFIFYKNKLLRVEDVNDYDEYGVRSCKLVMVQLADYQDLQDYIKYKEGEKII